jgi:tRNA(Ile)-lysidine synthase
MKSKYSESGSLFRARLEDSFAHALGVFFQHAPQTARNEPLNIIVAFSGGCDSMVLLQSLAAWKPAHKIKLTAVHVHHGLSPNADNWASFCGQTAKSLGVDFVLCRVRVESSGEGTEAAARKERYRALRETAVRIGSRIIITAHHKDDQLETFLIQWMRGSGIAGLIGMPLLKEEDGITVLRPFLGFARSELEAYAQINGFQWVEDESNSDTKYLRNVIRHQILPPMEAARKGWKDAALRSIDILAEAHEVLTDVADEDAAFVSDGKGNIQTAEFLSLSEARQALAFRKWLADNEFPTLSRTRLQEILRKIRESKRINALLFRTGNREIRLCGNAVKTVNSAPGKHSDWSFEWKGETEIAPENFEGILYIEEKETGFSEEQLKASPLIFSSRRGGERLKVRSSRPSKPLKQLYQEAEIPDFERSKYPLIRQKDALIFAAGIGEDVRFTSAGGSGKRFGFRWVASD